MDTQNWYDVTEFAPGTYMITEAQRYKAFLVLGTEQALLIDTLVGIGDLRRLVQSITALPLRVVLTHTHWDHLGSVHQFEEVGVHPKEAQNVAKDYSAQAQVFIQQRYDPRTRPFPAGFDPKTYTIKPGKVTFQVQEGDTIDLGGRTLRIYDTPGHSPGGISLLDEKEGVLFSGDMVKPLNPLYAHLDGANLQDYVTSMEKLALLAPEVRSVCSGHTDPFSDSSILAEMAAGLREVLEGKKSHRMVDSPWGKVKEFPFARFSVWLK